MGLLLYCRFQNSTLKNKFHMTRFYSTRPSLQNHLSHSRFLYRSFKYIVNYVNINRSASTKSTSRSARFINTHKTPQHSQLAKSKRLYLNLHVSAQSTCPRYQLQQHVYLRWYTGCPTETGPVSDLWNSDRPYPASHRRTFWNKKEIFFAIPVL